MDYFLWIEILIYIIFFIVAFSIFYTTLYFAPWVPSRKKDLARILELADLKEHHTVYELGAGNAVVCGYLARNSDAKVIGIEYSIPLYIWSKIRQLWSRNPKFEIRFQDLFKTDLSDADVIYTFSLPKPLATSLADKFKKELKPGARIISYSFQIEGWDHKIMSKPTENVLPIYIYEI